jgi:hypothetical protein
VPVVAVSSGAKVLAHEASIIATKERAERKIIEFFKKIVVDGAGHSITKRHPAFNHTAACAVKRAGIVDVSADRFRMPLRASPDCNRSAVCCSLDSQDGSASKAILV